jgi:hypothetical protein
VFEGVGHASMIRPLPESWGRREKKQKKKLRRCGAVEPVANLTIATAAPDPRVEQGSGAWVCAWNWRPEDRSNRASIPRWILVANGVKDDNRTPPLTPSSRPRNLGVVEAESPNPYMTCIEGCKDCCRYLFAHSAAWHYRVRCNSNAARYSMQLSSRWMPSST